MTTPVRIIAPREVPLGGLRAMTVRRTLPARGRTMIGAWCFLDHYGPDPVDRTGGMVVAPHPHTGLQTVSWLFEGAIEHRDSTRHRATVRPGGVNLMTAGRGISHSEISTSDSAPDSTPDSTPGSGVLHGVQLWVALPAAARDVAPGFEHHEAPRVEGRGWSATVLMGTLFGHTSPARTYSPLVGAEIVLAAGTTLTVPVDPAYEHGVLVDAGDVVVGGTPIGPAELGYLDPGANTVHVRADSDARIVLIGGEPLGEEIVMWWNFVGRSHDEIAAYREQWQALLAGEPQDRFALPDDDRHPVIAAPELPHVRLRPRA